MNHNIFPCITKTTHLGKCCDSLRIFSGKNDSNRACLWHIVWAHFEEEELISEKKLIFFWIPILLAPSYSPRLNLGFPCVIYHVTVYLNKMFTIFYSATIIWNQEKDPNCFNIRKYSFTMWSQRRKTYRNPMEYEQQKTWYQCGSKVYDQGRNSRRWCIVYYKVWESLQKLFLYIKNSHTFPENIILNINTQSKISVLRGISKTLHRLPKYTGLWVRVF